MEPVRARKYPRIPVDLPVHYAREGTEEEARAQMLGGGGMFVGTAQVIPPGTPLTVRFRPAKHLPVMEATARVCYCLEGQGIGVEFTRIDPQHRQCILRLIHHRTGERRRFPRVPLATQVMHAGGSFVGFSRDISTGGMFVETNEALDPGSKLDLRFHLEIDTSIVRAQAEVLYQVPKVGIGLHFEELSQEDFERIRDFVSRNSQPTPAAEGKH
jgi:c-di-GMP-binding flagellar brake protein YcgR